MRKTKNGKKQLTLNGQAVKSLTVVDSKKVVGGVDPGPCGWSDENAA